MTDATARKKLVYALAAEAAVDFRTVERWLSRGRTRPPIDQALTRAAAALKRSAEVAKLRGEAA